MAENQENENQDLEPEHEDEAREEKGHEEEREEEEESTTETDVGKTLFTIGQQVSYKGKACTVINEYERSLCIEYNHFPFPDESEEDFPYRREIIRKGEAGEALE
ncbi:hypothetical protein [Salibacterium aidingense]|uniref:hypothetical protein n=1 Tax=Salibacterium aidingense TaxID=384933 RepID=UPI0003FDC622|nr:hypothetical protein [Salibacterium aidingense]